MLIQLPM